MKIKLDHDAIFKAHLDGFSYTEIAKKFNCSKQAVGWIVLKKTDPKKYTELNVLSSKKSRAKIFKIEQLTKLVEVLEKENLKLKEQINSKEPIDSIVLIRGIS